MLKFGEYIAFRFLVAILRLCPFRVVYLMSDFAFFIIYYMTRYRRKVVYNNLRKSFPEKPENEIKKIEKKFYRHLCDITFESIKGMTINKSCLEKRFKIKNIEIPNSYFINGQSVIILASHYGNWEYGILATNMAIMHQAISLYLPLKNKHSEKYGLKRRSRFGMQMIAVQETKSIFENKPETPVAVIMAADQSPSNLEKAIWIKFLNQDTACLHGPEAYAKKIGLPIIYLKISKVKRGYYEMKFEDLKIQPNKTAPGEITEKYFFNLERDISEAPEYWLWSHRRWKHSRIN